MAIQLSMIVVITSWAPTVALRRPAIPPQIAPATIEGARARACTGRESPSMCDPTKSAALKPTQYWPWPPMLKRPQRNAKATRAPSDERRHQDQRLLEVVRGLLARLAGDHGKNQVETRAGEDRPR